MSQEAEPGKQGFFETPGFRRFLGRYLLGSYVAFIRLTSRLRMEPADQWTRIEPDLPVIALFWHGQHNTAYAYTPPDPKRWSILISSHPDGQIAWGIARRFGYNTIAGSGMSERQKHGTGGVAAFRSMVRALKDGQSLFTSADVPPVPGRNVSPGIVKLARTTGRPIYCVAASTSRRRILDRVWDKMQFNYPFSRVSYVWEKPIWVTDPTKSDEDYAREIAERLDRALSHAFELADKP